MTSINQGGNEKKSRLTLNKKPSWKKNVRDRLEISHIIKHKEEHTSSGVSLPMAYNPMMVSN